MTLLSHLPIGPRRACSVADLSAWSGLSEREVRDELARLARDEHQPIVTLPVKHGIYLATEPAHLDPAIADLRSRAGSMLRWARGLRIARESLAYSPEMFPEV